MLSRLSDIVKCRRRINLRIVVSSLLHVNATMFFFLKNKNLSVVTAVTIFFHIQVHFGFFVDLS